MSANSASCGGGLANRGFDGEVATLTVTNCTISGNSARRGCSGGGIGNIADSGGSATLMIANCTVSGNSVGGGPNLSNRRPQRQQRGSRNRKHDFRSRRRSWRKHLQ